MGFFQDLGETILYGKSTKTFKKELKEQELVDKLEFERNKKEAQTFSVYATWALAFVALGIVVYKRVLK